MVWLKVMWKIRWKLCESIRISKIFVWDEEVVQIISHNVHSLKAISKPFETTDYTLPAILFLHQEIWLENHISNEFVMIPNKSVIARNQIQEKSAIGKGTIIFGPDMSDLEPTFCYNGNFACKINLTMCTYNDVQIINVYRSKEKPLVKLTGLLTRSFKSQKRQKIYQKQL